MKSTVKCDGGDCPLKKECYRYTRPTGYEEAVYMEPPYKDGECKYYLTEGETDD